MAAGRALPQPVGKRVEGDPGAFWQGHDRVDQRLAQHAPCRQAPGHLRRDAQRDRARTSRDRAGRSATDGRPEPADRRAGATASDRRQAHRQRDARAVPRPAPGGAGTSSASSHSQPPGSSDHARTSASRFPPARVSALTSAIRLKAGSLDAAVGRQTPRRPVARPRLAGSGSSARASRGASNTSPRSGPAAAKMRKSSPRSIERFARAGEVALDQQATQLAPAGTRGGERGPFVVGEPIELLGEVGRLLEPLGDPLDQFGARGAVVMDAGRGRWPYGAAPRSTTGPGPRAATRPNEG